MVGGRCSLFSKTEVLFFFDTGELLLPKLGSQVCGVTFFLGSGFVRWAVCKMGGLQAHWFAWCTCSCSSSNRSSSTRCRCSSTRSGSGSWAKVVVVVVAYVVVVVVMVVLVEVVVQ